MQPSSLSDLLAQRATIEKQIVEAQREARAQAIAQVRALMSEHGLTPADLGTRAANPSPARKSTGAKVPPKYRDPVTGSTWSGRGLQPKWLRAAIQHGKQLSDFSI